MVVLRERDHLLARAGEHNAAAAADQRALCGCDCLQSLFDLERMALYARLVADDFGLFRINEFRDLVFLNIGGHVDQHGAGTACGCDVERLLKDPRQIRGVFDKVAVLCKGLARAGDIGLLEHVAPELLRIDLSGDGDHRDGVHIRGCNPGDEIGRAGAGGSDAYAGFAAGTGVSVGHVCGVLLLAHKDVFDFGLVKHIVERADGCARIPEGDGNAFLFQTLHHDFSTADQRESLLHTK